MKTFWVSYIQTNNFVTVRIIILYNRGVMVEGSEGLEEYLVYCCEAKHEWSSSVVSVVVAYVRCFHFQTDALQICQLHLWQLVVVNTWTRGITFLTETDINHIHAHIMHFEIVINCWIGTLVIVIAVSMPYFHLCSVLLSICMSFVVFSCKTRSYYHVSYMVVISS